MTMDDLSKLQVSVGKLETSMGFTLEQNKKLDEKLDLILVNITRLSAEREADLHSVRFSIKKKINDSIHELKSYHDVDLKTVHEHIEKMKWAQWPNKYPKATAFVIIAVTLTIWETLWGNRALIKDVLDYLPFS